MRIQMVPPATSQADEFLTTDHAESSFLVALGVPLLAVRPDGRRAVFVFPGTARQVAQRFWTPGKDDVPARAYHAALRELRELARRQVGP